MKRLESASAVHHIQRFEMIRIQTQQAMEELYGNQLDAIDDLARSIFENGYYHSLFSIQKKAVTGWSVNAINKDRLEKVIKRPWAPDGEAFSSRIWKNKAKMINELHTALTQGCITGAPVERVAKQMAERLGVGASNAERLLRTEAAHFATEGDIQGYKDTGVKEYQYIAALDHKTCEICAELDEQVIKVSDYEEGVNAPPLHPNCRCTTVPYFDDEFTVGETRAARDENGKTVQIPADMSYGEWLGKVGKQGMKTTNLIELSRVYINHQDKLYENMKNVEPYKDFEDFGVHGDPDTIEIQTNNNQGTEYTAKEFADMLKADPEYHGGKIRLLACQIGAKENGFAQQLSNELEVDILAPTELLWVTEKGEMFISDNELLAEMWYNNGDIDTSIEPTGKWKMFYPKRR